MAVEILRAGPADRNAAYAIVSEYCQALNVVVRDDPEAFCKEYFGPAGGFWLALAGGQPVGCIALRKLPSPGCAEIKRMYVREEWRGRGISQKLLQAAERFARESGYQWIYLDTTDGMQAAARLYERTGYRPCARYNQNPQATIFMRKRLSSGPSDA
jgi:GNAT superfamily N-acetyltransferase